MDWSIMNVWNEALERSDRVLEPRQRIYASEIGGSMIDRYHKMKATPYTNPPNSRSMRKFMAGDIWEWIIRIVLVKAGLPHRQQERILLEYPGMLPISGKIDFIAGGKPDYEKAHAEIEKDDIPDFIKNQAYAVIDYLKEKFPEGFGEKILEIKSVGSFVFEGLLEQDNPKTHHMYQAFCYHKATGIPADVVYVCRDDVRLLQYNIDSIAEMLEPEVLKDIEQITNYVTKDIEPEKEALIIWDPISEKFKTNWKVQYSPYLTMLYTYKDADGHELPIQTPDEYFDYFTPKVSAWNRVVKRVKDGAKITDANQVYIAEMLDYGFDLLSMITPKEETTYEE